MPSRRCPSLYRCNDTCNIDHHWSVYALFVQVSWRCFHARYQRTDYLGSSVCHKFCLQAHYKEKAIPDLDDTHFGRDGDAIICLIENAVIFLAAFSLTTATEIMRFYLSASILTIIIAPSLKPYSNTSASARLSNSLRLSNLLCSKHLHPTLLVQIIRMTSLFGSVVIVTVAN